VRLLYAYADALVDADRESDARDWFAKAAAADRDGDTDAAERLADLEGLEIIDTEEGESEDDVIAASAAERAVTDTTRPPAAVVEEEKPVIGEAETSVIDEETVVTGEDDTAVTGEEPPPSVAEVVISEAGIPGIAFSAEEPSSTVTPTDPVPEVAFSPPPSAPQAAPGDQES
jgi:hypothetical protein